MVEHCSVEHISTRQPTSTLWYSVFPFIVCQKQSYYTHHIERTLIEWKEEEKYIGKSRYFFFY